MKRLLKWVAVAGVAACLAPASAMAQQWVEIARGETGAVIYIDAESIRHEGDEALIWERWDFSGAPSSDYGARKTLTRVRCQSRQSAPVASTKYDRQGKVISTIDWKAEELDFSADAPGSVGAKLAAYACEH